LSSKVGWGADRFDFSADKDYRAMKRAQLLGVAIAGVCGLGAFFGVMSLVKNPTKVVKEEITTNTTQVLVARADIGLGQTIGPESVTWLEWPQSAVNAAYIQRNTHPGLLKELDKPERKLVARVPLLAREPLTPQKVVIAGEGGVLAAILPAGMRAISTRIKEETGVGRLILPNDRVDVIHTRTARGRGGDQVNSETLFHNVRVLAIGQIIEAKDGNKKLAEGNTATLELTPAQAQRLAEANSGGEISLSLRSIADTETKDGPAAARRGDTIRIIKYGVKSGAYGVN
jgi:pilus assembly protein CpaB